MNQVLSLFDRFTDHLHAWWSCVCSESGLLYWNSIQNSSKISVVMINELLVSSICIFNKRMWFGWENNYDTVGITLAAMGLAVFTFVILQIKLWESHWLFRRVYSFIFKAAAGCSVTSRKLHCDVMKPHYSWHHGKFFLYNFQTAGMFLSPQRLYCCVSAQLECFSGLLILNKPFFSVIFLMLQKVFKFYK